MSSIEGRLIDIKIKRKIVLKVENQTKAATLVLFIVTTLINSKANLNDKRTVSEWLENSAYEICDNSVWFSTT